MKLKNSLIILPVENSLASKAKAVTKVLLCMSILAFSHYVKAQGVEAGTNISNIAVTTYSIDSVVQDPIESSPFGNSSSGTGNGTATEFVVDRKIDLLVTGNTDANVTPGDSQVEVTFTLQNQGNAVQEFSLSTNSQLPTDDFDVNSCNVEITGVNGTPATGVVLPTTGDIKLLPDQQASISVKCDIPTDNNGSAISTGHTALVGLTASTEKNDDGSNVVELNASDSPEVIETVFADEAGSDDSDRDAKHSARRTYISSISTAAPTLTMNKTIVSVTDPDGGNTAVTGSEVTYKINIVTSGTGSIENLIISDPTPANMTYKLNSISLNASSQTDLSDADKTDFGISASDTATINLGTFVAGTQHEILLTYIIN